MGVEDRNVIVVVVVVVFVEESFLIVVVVDGRRRHYQSSFECNEGCYQSFLNEFNGRKEGRKKLCKKAMDQQRGAAAQVDFRWMTHDPNTTRHIRIT